MVLLCNPGSHGAGNVDQADLKFPETHLCLRSAGMKGMRPTSTPFPPALHVLKKESMTRLSDRGPAPLSGSFLWLPCFSSCRPQSQSPLGSLGSTRTSAACLTLSSFLHPCSHPSALVSLPSRSHFLPLQELPGYQQQAGMELGPFRAYGTTHAHKCTALRVPEAVCPCWASEPAWPISVQSISTNVSHGLSCEKAEAPFPHLWVSTL